MRLTGGPHLEDARLLTAERCRVGRVPTRPPNPVRAHLMLRVRRSRILREIAQKLHGVIVHRLENAILTRVGDHWRSASLVTSLGVSATREWIHRESGAVQVRVTSFAYGRASARRPSKARGTNRAGVVWMRDQSRHVPGRTDGDGYSWCLNIRGSRARQRLRGSTAAGGADGERLSGAVSNMA